MFSMINKNKILSEILVIDQGFAEKVKPSENPKSCEFQTDVLESCVLHVMAGFMLDVFQMVLASFCPHWAIVWSSLLVQPN